MKFAFLDQFDGYYEIDLPEGAPFPAWTEGMTPTSVIPPQPAPVPFSVPMRKARKALRAAGKLTAVEVALAAMPGTAGADARDDWEYSSTVERDNPTLLAMAQAIGLTNQEIDQLFITANSYP